MMKNVLTDCPGCGVKPGMYHESGCIVEQCPYCGGESVCCPCEDEPPLDDRMPWTGQRPGVAECRELGLYARPSLLEGWTPCEWGDAGATEDLGTLYLMAEWDRDAKQFVLPGRMTEERLWRMIEVSKRRSGGDIDRQVTLLTERLAGMPVEAIRGAEDIINVLVYCCQEEGLMGLATSLGCGEFEDFCGWLIAQGEELYRDALDDPAILTGFADSRSRCRAMLEVAASAFRAKTGMDLYESVEAVPDTR